MDFILTWILLCSLWHNVLIKPLVYCIVLCCVVLCCVVLFVLSCVALHCIALYCSLRGPHLMYCSLRGPRLMYCIVFVEMLITAPGRRWMESWTMSVWDRLIFMDVTLTGRSTIEMKIPTRKISVISNPVACIALIKDDVNSLLKNPTWKWTIIIKHINVEWIWGSVSRYSESLKL